MFLPAWCFVGLSALCVVAMVVVGALSARGCRVAPIPLTPGAGTELAIAIPADTPCTILIPAGSAILDDITVDTPPQHGTLTARGRAGTVYRPNRGFKGDDAFAFSLNARCRRRARKLDRPRAGERQVEAPPMQMHQIPCHFLALRDELSFTRAARRSGVSQPSLTNAIAALEQELGGALFQRRPVIALHRASGARSCPISESIAENADADAA